VVRLADDRPSAAGEAVDTGQPPQGPLHVERAPEHAPRQRPQLASAAGRGERHAVHVTCDVEAGVVDPLVAFDAAAEARQCVEAGVDVAPQRGDGGGRALELQGPADMQGCLSGLEIKEGCVESAEAVWLRHAARSLPQSESLKDPENVPKN
jgi:hypothetical protein